MNIVVIPARGGSKGIPRKNLQEIGGVSLIGRSVITAKQADLVDLVIVSTDDPEIKHEAELHGAEVVTRPKRLSCDTAASEPVVTHALHAVDAEEGNVILMQCTSPFTLPIDLDAALDVFEEANADTLFTASYFHSFVWEYRWHNWIGVNHDVNKPRQRRQDAKKQWLENGAFYIMDIPGFYRTESRFFGNIIMYEIPAERSLEIDCHFELDLARAINDMGKN